MVTEPKEAYNRAHIFIGENYGYQKACMYDHINFIDTSVWNAIINGPNEITVTNYESVIIPKSKGQWNNNDRKLWSHDWKTQNILIYVLGVDECYHVSHCETSKAIQDALEVAREGTNEVKQARVNTLNQEFEIFHMKHGETIAEMQKRYTHIINRLNALCKPISNDIATNKVLRCLNREWQPKVTIIKQANDLKVLNLTTLFGELEEHEQEFTCLEKHEKEYENKVKKKKGRDKEEKKKSIALKISSSKSSNNEHSDCETKDDKDSDEEDMGLFIKKYNRYMWQQGNKYSEKDHSKSRRLSNSSKEYQNKKGNVGSS